MKRIFYLLFVSLFLTEAAFSTKPTLSASATQPTYPGTSKPYLTIVSGSGKTSYVSGVINDPTDPAAMRGIYFTITNGVTSTSATSNKTSVVPNANISFVESGGFYVLKIIPATVGYATISVSATNADGTSSVYKISYAASVASSHPDKTIFPVNMADASGASPVDNDYMFVADDETNVLRLFSRKYSGVDLYNIDITSTVGASAECDLEGSSLSIKYNPGKRVYWIGSLGNNKSGVLKPDRDRVIATDISGTGAASTLTVKSYSTKFRSSLISWGDANGWGFTTSAASGMIPKRIDGFNIEGLSITQGGDTGYIGFRAPCVPVKGTTPGSSNRKYAIVAPVTNFETIMNGNGSVSTAPIIGEPILFDLEGLGIRSMERVGPSGYLIIAGLYTGGGTPAVYWWDGRVPANPGLNPITVNTSYSKLIKLNLPGLNELAQVSSDGEAEGHPEAMIAEQVGQVLFIHLICDNGTVDYYNDGTEAKSLSNIQFKKFRYDNFVFDFTNTTGNCPNGQIKFISGQPQVAGNIYQWQMDTGSGYIDIANGGIYSGSKTDTLLLVNAPTSMYGYQYRCKVSNGASITYSNETPLTFRAYWVGAVSNAWENPANWSCNTLPDNNTDVYINFGTPVLNSNTSIRSLQVNPTANLTINTGKVLSILH